MNRLLSHNLWPTVVKLAKYAVKRAAIAYVSTDQYIRFGDGDLLICDASRKAIKTGQTSAKVLKGAYDRRASLFNLPGLHAKILLLNDKAVIGSANASQSSAESLIEAALLTDQPTIVATAQSFVNQLRSQAEELTEAKLNQLLKIKVVKQSHPAGVAKNPVHLKMKEHRTWIVGTHEMVKEHPDEESAVKAAEEECREKLSNPRSSVHRVRWTGSSRFRQLCKADDWLIQTWRPNGAKVPTLVYERMPVLARVDEPRATYFLYEEFPKSDTRAKSWTEFKKLAESAGIRRQIKKGSQFEITEAQADALQALWKG